MSVCGTEERQRMKHDKQRRIFALCFILIIFCVLLFAIRLVNAASNNKQMVLNKKNVSLAAGNTQKLSVRNLPDTAKVTWKSSKKSVASVDKNGRVKAKKKGKAAIKCKITYGRKGGKTKTLECKVTVTGKEKNKKSVVYMTKDISPEGLMAVYKRLNWNAKGKTAVKVSTGEPPASNYLDLVLVVL